MSRGPRSFGRYALKQGIELPKSENAAGSFPDADKISEYAREFVELMRIAGILNGYEDGTGFRPAGQRHPRGGSPSCSPCSCPSRTSSQNKRNAAALPGSGFFYGAKAPATL